MAEKLLGLAPGELVINMLTPIFKVSALAVILSLLVPLGSAYSEGLATLQMEIKYTNGDRAGAYQTNYVVYQDNGKSPFLEKNLETNPGSISLPQDHRYKVEVFVNDMFSGVGYAELKNEQEKLDINIPLPGGLKFNVFFEDGETPMDNVIVKIKSNDGNEQILSLIHISEPTRPMKESRIPSCA